MAKKKLAFVDHNYHKKTRSGDFLREIFSKDFIIEDFWWSLKEESKLTCSIKMRTATSTSAELTRVTRTRLDADATRSFTSKRLSISSICERLACDSKTSCRRSKAVAASVFLTTNFEYVSRGT